MRAQEGLISVGFVTFADGNIPQDPVCEERVGASGRENGFSLALMFTSSMGLRGLTSIVSHIKTSHHAADAGRLHRL